MSAIRPWSAPSSYAAYRATAWAKAIARRVVATGVGILPGPAFRIAGYIVALEQARAKRVVRTGAPPLERPRVGFTELLGNADASLDHLAILNLLKASGDLTDAVYHRYLNTTFAARRLDLVDRALADGGFGFADTALFHSLRLQQYRGEITIGATEAIAAFARLAANTLHSDNAANVVADLLARRGNSEDLAAFLETLPPEHLTRLAASTFFGCARLLTASGSTRVAWLRNAYLDALSPEQQLYFLEVLPPRDQTKLLGAPLTPQAALKRFAAVYSSQDAQDRADFERCALEPLRRQATGPNAFMNIRFDRSEQTALLGKFSTALETGKGFGLVRLGDGEAYGYDHAGLGIAADADFREDNQTRERMWWGRVLPAAARTDIKRRFRQSVAEADAIGIPSVYRMIRDRGPAGSAFGQNSGQRGLAVVLAKLGTDIPLIDKILTEERCHQILFTRPELEALAAKAGRVVLVSCWRADQLALKSTVPVHEIVIPGHTKVAKATGLETGAPALFQTFDDQIASMAALCGPGTLVLVGAGFLGKIFIAAARNKGAVALDVGAVLDYLAGYKTRSLADLG